jgi:hypothetical protein
LTLRSRIHLRPGHAGRAAGSAGALSGLNSIRQTLDSLSRLSGFDRQGSQVNVAVQTNINFSPTQIAERVINKLITNRN